MQHIVAPASGIARPGLARARALAIQRRFPTIFISSLNLILAAIFLHLKQTPQLRHWLQLTLSVAISLAKHQQAKRGGHLPIIHTPIDNQESSASNG